MKNLFGLLMVAAVIALGGAFAELWTLPYLGGFPTYSELGEKRARAIEGGADREEAEFQAPFANSPNADSSRRATEMRTAQDQLEGGR
jgi:hypothetical protein